MMRNSKSLGSLGSAGSNGSVFSFPYFPNFLNFLNFFLISAAAVFAQGSKAVFYQSLAWSPDGKSLAVTAFSDYDARTDEYRTGVFIMNADGSNPKKLSDGSGHNIFPSFAPGDGRIVFSRRDDRDAEKSYTDASYLYTIDADGSNLKKLSGINSFYARYSPDGKKLAFVAGKFPANAIYIARADGSKIKKLTE